jgi:fructokinase
MTESLTSRYTVCCIGEVLWDALPAGLFLGGAPLNVCCHLKALGEQAVMISQVGADRLGREALRNLNAKGVRTDHIQIDSRAETGFVEVDLAKKEGPDYDIVEPAAWDFIEYNPSVQALAKEADVVVFGTLAQRNEVSRRTIQSLIKRDDVLRIYDINLRPPYNAPAIVRESLRYADIVKLNEEELIVLADWFNYPDSRGPAAERLAEEFSCRQICITCGREGAALLNEGTWTHQPGYEVEVADTIGSGDAFLAAFIYGLSHFGSDEDRLRFANLLGAFVAAKAGATPSYSPKDIKTFAKARGVQIPALWEHGSAG